MSSPHSLKGSEVDFEGRVLLSFIVMLVLSLSIVITAQCPNKSFPPDKHDD
jgi:hypothetical protein